MKKTDDVLICAHCGQVIDGREGSDDDLASARDAARAAENAAESAAKAAASAARAAAWAAAWADERDWQVSELVKMLEVGK